MKETKPRRRKSDKRITGENGNKNTPSRLASFRNLSTGSYIFTFILVIVTLLIYDITFASEEIVDITAIKSDLLSNVHNQNDSVQIILDSLKQMQEQTQIINFIGSTGVGKTYIANILKKYFHSVFELNGISDKNAQNNLINKLKYSNFDYNLVIVEDLTETDLENLVTFLKVIPEDVGTFVICIFNIQETDDKLNYKINYSHVEKIIKKFNEAEIPYKNAKFHEFNKKQARHWVLQQLIKKGINVDDQNQIIETLLNNQDITHHGLKGLNSKINLEM